jgi:hypothetical protein
MRVSLIPTGQAELQGLASALQARYHEHDFVGVADESRGSAGGSRQPYSGISSYRLGEDRVAHPPESAVELIGRSVQEALGDRDTRPSDLVVILDDAELANADQPERMVAVMRSAVMRHIESIRVVRTRERTATVLREKVSFHIAMPMLEAWFFADPNALERAGVRPDAIPRFNEDWDPECFDVNDDGYLSALEGDCKAWSCLPAEKQRKLRPKWLGAGERKKHPKGYLQWLCIEPGDRKCTRYSEAECGATALAGIQWDLLLRGPRGRMRFLRAMVEDIDDGLGNEFGSIGPVPTVVTSRSRDLRDCVLRNI